MANALPTSPMAGGGPPQVDLSALRDIHLPDAVSFWPPAIGWWLVLLAVIVLVGSVILFKTMRRRRQIRREAMAELDRLVSEHQTHNDDHALLKELSILLRRLVISCYPRDQVAALEGEAWLAFLDAQLGGKAAGFADSAALLVSGPYQANIPDYDVAATIALTRRFIKRLPPALIAQVSRQDISTQTVTEAA